TNSRLVSFTHFHKLTEHKPLAACELTTTLIEEGDKRIVVSLLAHRPKQRIDGEGNSNQKQGSTRIKDQADRCQKRACTPQGMVVQPSRFVHSLERAALEKTRPRKFPHRAVSQSLNRERRGSAYALNMRPSPYAIQGTASVLHAQP